MSFPIRSPRPRLAAPGPGRGAVAGAGRRRRRAAQAPAEADARLLERGRSLAIAADCLACHTQAGGGKPCRRLSHQQSAGRHLRQQHHAVQDGGHRRLQRGGFARALREGVRRMARGCIRPCPTSYTLITDEDMKALYAYFMKGVAPVDEPAPVTRLPFPFSVRASMLGWNLLFLDNRRYTPDPSKSEQINRGAYLANALAHCGSCHTPRNALMAETPAARWAVGRRAVVRAEHQLGSRRWHRRLVGGRTGAVPAHRPRRRQGPGRRHDGRGGREQFPAHARDGSSGDRGYLKSTAPVGPESAADSKRPAGTAYDQGRAASERGGAAWTARPPPPA